MKYRASGRAAEPAFMRGQLPRTELFTPSKRLESPPVGPIGKPAAGPAIVSTQNIEIASAVLEDGSQIEIIEDPQDSEKSLLAIFNNGDIQLTDRVQVENRIFVPIARTSNLLRHVHLPKGALDYGSTDSLISETRALLCQALDLASADIDLLALFVLSTWLIDRVSVAPYLALVGLPGSGKSTALSALNLLCRRGLLTADISSAAFYRVCDRLTPTLLIDEASTSGNSRALFHLLRTGTTRDVTALRKHESFKTFGAKAIAWIDLPNDAALNSRCIVVPLRETRNAGLLRPTAPEFRKAAAHMQMSFLRFRFEKLESPALPKIKAKVQLCPRSRDLYDALALPIAEIPKKCQWLVERLVAREEITRVPLSVKQSAVLGAAFATMHVYTGEKSQRVGELTAFANAILDEAGEHLHVNPREVGAILTSLGFTGRKRTNKGWVISSDNKQWVHAHSLVGAYGIGPLPPIVERNLRRNCDDCRKLPRR